MRLAGVILSGLLIVVGLSQFASASEFTVARWVLGVRAVNPHYEEDSHVITAVENPFIASHSVAVDQTSAASAYDFAWDGAFGRFLIEGDQQDEDLGDSGWSESSGSIRISTTVDLLITVHGEYTYDLPGLHMTARVGLTVMSTGYVCYLSERANVATYYEPTASGTLLIDGQTIVPAGDTYALSYTMETSCVGYQPGLIAEGSGFMDITIQALPEPGTLSLLTLGGMLLHRRRS